ncbi:MAG TPA: transposase [Terriglobales bacterium]|nr:transposase [Terriglobales bacterium]
MRQRKGEAARAYWRELIGAQANSGRNVAEFCRARGVPRTCFFAWRRKLEAAPAATPAFLEVKLAPDKYFA